MCPLASKRNSGDILMMLVISNNQKSRGKLLYSKLIQ